MVAELIDVGVAMLVGKIKPALEAAVIILVQSDALLFAPLESVNITDMLKFPGLSYL